MRNVNMKKLLLITAISFCGTVYAGQMFRDLDSKYLDLISENEIRRFNADTWKNSNPKIRGEMLYDLFYSTQFVGKPIKYIIDLLGKNTGTFVSNDRPCYKINYDGVDYYLGFRMVNQNKVPIVDSIVFYKFEELSITKEKIWEMKAKANKFIGTFKDKLVIQIKKYSKICFTYVVKAQDKITEYINQKLKRK